MNSTNITDVIQQLQAAGIHIPFSYHGLTAFHGMAVLAAGWITHTNWDKVLAAYSWIIEHGGIYGLCVNFLIGQKQPTPPKQ